MGCGIYADDTVDDTAVGLSGAKDGENLVDAGHLSHRLFLDCARCDTCKHPCANISNAIIDCIVVGMVMIIIMGADG